MTKKTTLPPAPTTTESAKKAAFPNWLKIALAALALVVLTAVAFQPALDNDFVDWDDYTYVVENDMVRNEKTPVSTIFKRPVSLNYHPITMWSMRMNNNKCEKCSEGISARPFILTNLVFHILNVLLIFGLIYYLSSRNFAVSFVIALWFGVHPMHVESVAWVSERKDVLYTFFFLAAMATYLRYLQAQKILWLGLTLSLFVLACLSKAMAVVFPVAMILLAFWQHKADAPSESIRAALAPRRLIEYVPFFAFALFFGLMAVKIQSGQNFMGLLDVSKNTPVAINDFNTFKLTERFSFAAHGYSSYIAKFFYPTDLCTFYPYPTRPIYDASGAYWSMVLAIMLISLLGAGVLAFLGKQKWQKMYVFGLGFYFITVVLVLQFLSVGLVIMADRYAYLPYLGLAFALFMPITLANRQVQTILFALLAAVGLLFVTQTRKQVDTWQDSEALWAQVIETQKAGGNIDNAYSIRGHYYGKQADKAAKKGDQAKVKLYLDKAFADLQSAMQLGSQKVEVHEGLGNIYGMRGQYEDALQSYAKAIAADSSKSSLYFNLAVTYGMLQRWKDAADAYDKSEARGIERPKELRNNRVIARINAGLFQEALQDLDWLIQNDPNTYNHHTNKGIVKMKLGDTAAARACYERALQLKPDDAFTRQKLQEVQ
jgi:protein O-mannosyl-transferase